MVERIEEFTRNDKNFMYVDLSKLKKNADFIRIVDAVKQLIVKYPEKSVYTIINIENISFDWETREIGGDVLKHNNPYVKYGSIIGVDGIKKFLITAVFMYSDRNNMRVCDSREQAIDWLLQQD